MKLLALPLLVSFLAAAIPATAQTNTFPASGNVGVGTTTPTAKLYVNNGDNSVGSVLATNGEGPGELRVHSYTTQPSSVPAFGIAHAFYNDEHNGFIDFWRGGGTSGGFLTFGTSGNERLRIDTNGNIGIGTTTPSCTLQIQSQSTTPAGYPSFLLTGSQNAERIYIESTSGDAVFRAAEAGGTVAAPTPNLQGSALGYFQTGGYDGSVWTRATWMQGIASETWSTTAHGADLVLSTTPNGSTSIAERMRISNNGNVGIGTTNPTYPLSVNGTIEAKEVIVQTGWSDFVFAPNYRLAPLSEVDATIKAEHHLPGIPSAQQVAAHGINLGDMQAKLLAKIEELTLHQIEQENELYQQQQRMKLQEERIEHLEEENQKLRKADHQ
jgi:hypothetical protein